MLTFTAVEHPGVGVPHGDRGNARGHVPGEHWFLDYLLDEVLVWKRPIPAVAGIYLNTIITTSSDYLHHLCSCYVCLIIRLHFWLDSLFDFDFFAVYDFPFARCQVELAHPIDVKLGLGDHHPCIFTPVALSLFAAVAGSRSLHCLPRLLDTPAD